MAMPDLTGRTFGRLTVVGPPGPEHGPLPPVAGGWWLARCQCGRELVSPAEAYLARRVTSCGRPGPEARGELAGAIATRQPPPRI
jgi:hypothetical protein